MSTYMDGIEAGVPGTGGGVFSSNPGFVNLVAKSFRSKVDIDNGLNEAFVRKLYHTEFQYLT